MEKDSHGRLGKAREMEILSNPDGVYKAQNGNLVFHKGGDVVVTHGKGSAQGNVITSYGESGPRGESGAAVHGGLPSQPGVPISAGDITGGKIPKPGGGFIHPQNR